MMVTNDPTVRFCSACQKDVFLCVNDEQIDTHIDADHCIAADFRAKRVQAIAQHKTEIDAIKQIFAKPFVGYIAPKK